MAEETSIINIDQTLEKELYEARDELNALKGKYADNHPGQAQGKPAAARK